ncbi:hypothetical protein QPX96_11510 [Limosilactobacillus fermentum]|nr:hypothetical protein [Limosilactobacillus fermentum]MDN3537755.1 hypothetical protein [Limosilactobacillus fermentum]MDN3537852.1 hypothetical protein [Limosilactobacillus fermentum]
MANEEKLLQENDDLKQIIKEQKEIIEQLKQLLYGKKRKKYPLTKTRHRYLMMKN